MEVESNTPPKKRLSASCSKEGIVMMRAMPRGSVPMVCPQLTESNYQLWAVKLKIIMRWLGVWVAIEGDAEVEEEMDQGALAAISQSVPDDVMVAIIEYGTANLTSQGLRASSVAKKVTSPLSARSRKRRRSSPTTPIMSRTADGRVM
jgi:hypothetical protein